MDDEIAEIVREHGWFAASISDCTPPFLYSIGLIQTYNHPELIVFGLDGTAAHALVSKLVHNIGRNQSYADSGVYKVKLENGVHRLGFRRVHVTQHPLYLGFAMGFCRRVGRVGGLEAVQVFWPDESGRFPFETGCDLAAFQAQPRLDVPLSPSEIKRFERRWE